MQWRAKPGDECVVSSDTHSVLTTLLLRNNDNNSTQGADLHWGQAVAKWPISATGHTVSPSLGSEAKSQSPTLCNAIKTRLSASSEHIPAMFWTNHAIFFRGIYQSAVHNISFISDLWPMGISIPSLRVTVDTEAGTTAHSQCQHWLSPSY